MEWVDWLLKTILGRIITAILGLGSPVVLGFLKRRGSSWFAPLLWGMIGLALSLVCFVAVVGISAFSHLPKEQPPQVTPENIEEHIRTWLDTFGFSTRSVDNPEAYFEIDAVAANASSRFSVMRTRKLDRYIQIQARLSVDKDRLAALPKDGLESLIRSLRMEMLRSKLDYGNIKAPLHDFVLATRIPITGALTEETFMERVGELTSAEMLAAEIVRRELGLPT
jgi:hypothetical protein